MLDLSGPPIIKDEVRHAPKKMMTGKSADLVEVLDSIEEVGAERFHGLKLKIYKSGSLECLDHRTISLISLVLSCLVL